MAGGWLMWTATGQHPPQPATVTFDGQRALTDVDFQTSLGPRTVGSVAHSQTIEWIRAELKDAGWQSEIQYAEMLGHPIQNVIAYRTNITPKIILGAHYDSRLFADNDPDPAKRNQPVPGANDGASGVAVLLELARTLPQKTPAVWLVFLDAEDNGRINGWDWILGSRAFVQQNDIKPEAVVIVDMVGDSELNIYMENNSDAALSKEIWGQASQLGYNQAFIPIPKYTILDDHVPFLDAGIPAVDIIDIDYPYWHTTADTTDKISARSLQIVGDTLWHWIVNKGEK